jgi:hypothetical protein
VQLLEKEEKGEINKRISTSAAPITFEWHKSTHVPGP